MSDVAADEARRVALGEEDPQRVRESSSDALEGSDESTGWVARLWDGSADGPTVRELREDYDLPRWGLLGLRGILRVATGDGVPPIAEILLAGVLFVLEGNRESSADEEGEEIEVTRMDA